MDLQRSTVLPLIASGFGVATVSLCDRGDVPDIASSAPVIEPGGDAAVTDIVSLRVERQRVPSIAQRDVAALPTRPAVIEVLDAVSREPLSGVFRAYDRTIASLMRRRFRRKLRLDTGSVAGEYFVFETARHWITLLSRNEFDEAVDTGRVSLAPCTTCRIELVKPDRCDRFCFVVTLETCRRDPMSRVVCDSRLRGWCRWEPPFVELPLNTDRLDCIRVRAMNTDDYSIEPVATVAIEPGRRDYLIDCRSFRPVDRVSSVDVTLSMSPSCPDGEFSFQLRDVAGDWPDAVRQASFADHDGLDKRVVGTLQGVAPGTWQVVLEFPGVEILGPELTVDHTTTRLEVRMPEFADVRPPLTVPVAARSSRPDRARARRSP